MTRPLTTRLREAPARVRGWIRWLPYRWTYGHGMLLMSELRKARVRLIHPGAHIQFGRGTYLGPGFHLQIPHGGTFITGERVEFRRGFRAEVAGNGRIVIGSGTICTYDVVMQVTTSIEIGERCLLAQSTLVVDGNHRFRDISAPLLAQGYDFEQIKIGDDAFVASKCSIMSSVGERAVVGANAVLTRPAPPYCVMGGVPARVLDYFGPPGGEPEDLTTRRAPATDHV